MDKNEGKNTCPDHGAFGFETQIQRVVKKMFLPFLMCELDVAVKEMKQIRDQA